MLFCLFNSVTGTLLNDNVKISKNIKVSGIFLKKLLQEKIIYGSINIWYKNKTHMKKKKENTTMIKPETIAGVYTYNFIKLKKVKNTFFNHIQIADY